MNQAPAKPAGDGLRIAPTSPAAPTRVIIRTVCDFLVAVSAEGVRSNGNMMRWVVMTAIMVANVEHITRSTVRKWRYAGMDQFHSDSELRPITVHRLSTSLRTPFETVRRHVIALQREGLCVKTGKGVIMPPEVLQSKRISTSEAIIWDAFWRMINKFKSLDFDFSSVVGEDSTSNALDCEEGFSRSSLSQAPRPIVSGLIMEFYLNASSAAHVPNNDDWLTATVSTGLMCLNSAGFSRDGEESWRYATADTPPPDSLRAPASIGKVAKLTALNKELVRRKMHELIAAGRVDRAENGYLVSMTYMQGANSRASAIVIVTAFYRMIYDLKVLGVPL